VSRRAPRFRTRIAVTITPVIGGGELAVCHTRDVSEVGMSLETAHMFGLGTRLVLSLLDDARGAVVEVIGEVSRHTQGGFGVRLIEPSVDWRALVAAAARRGGPQPEKPARRMRVLVVGDDQRQRGALALYVTSGWDVRFANDLDTTSEALRGVKLDAVIAEHDADDPRWQPILAAAQKAQPAARRIVRGVVRNIPDVEASLVHRFVDRDAGLDALLDALTADLGPQA